MHNKTIAEISRDLAAGEYSSTEITTDLLARVKDLDKGLNSFITVTEEQALAQAKAADERRAAGNATPWTGVPMAHKDIFCTKGVLTTCGSKMLSNFEAPYDATVVENFNNAGAVSLGKTTWTNSPWGHPTKPLTSAR